MEKGQSVLVENRVKGIITEIFKAPINQINRFSDLTDKKKWFRIETEKGWSVVVSDGSDYMKNEIIAL